MNESKERIQFIVDYISAYEEKIKLLNNCGLFDAAKLFELFAIEVGSLYLGQRLFNLNINTYTYPCVDLVSEDGHMYVQVSTVKDIPAKIRRTLEKIKTSKGEKIDALKNVKFFMLYNESTDKVIDYTGKKQIGNIPFVKKNDLITTKDIIRKAIDELDFQKDLYELLKRETDSVKHNSYKFQEAVANSRAVGLGNIDCKINNEYEIERRELIFKIKADNYQNISIQGGAGSGKSVLCKKLVEEEVNLIYARAERFIEETDINSIWGFNVRQTLEYLNGKRVIFFIDSLEFIADSRTKLDLLCILYECTKKYPSVRIITSCRSSDKGSFIKIENSYSVYSYELPELTKSEQLEVAEKYPIIKKMLDMNSYAELLKFPFYINLIVSRISDIGDISNENRLREYIWKNIICLDDNKVREVIESIVFIRAKEFLLGVNSSKYDAKIIKRLLSEGILVRNGNTVRLKYDIFEDICFEQYLDDEFSKCRGKFNEFFDEIELLGRCVYRRYQIWISNKLFEKNNREKFLYELIFSTKVPQDWKKQTQIGLIKSRHCMTFFEEYGVTIIKDELLNEFLKTINLYGFEIKNNFGEHPPILLVPSGEGRDSIIHLIFKSSLYKEDKTPKLELVKICSDYSKVPQKKKQTAEEVCMILEYLIDKYIIEDKEINRHNSDDIVKILLPSLYQMVEYSKEWIKDFWKRLENYYKSENHKESRLAEEIIEDTLKFKHTKLAEYLPTEICNLAEMFWTYLPDNNHKRSCHGFYERERDDLPYQYGLSEKALDYEDTFIRRNVIKDNFFFVLFRTNFWTGLNWTISFVNRAVTFLAKKYEDDVFAYEINFIEENFKKTYIGIPSMWLATVETQKMPAIIGDLLFCLKNELRFVIENDVVQDKETYKFAYNVRKHIYNTSNNIALLSIIADIGMEFRKKLPGYALDLATNIDLIRNDLVRQAFLVKDSERKMLEEQMYMVLGIPSSMIPDRYNKKSIKELSLLDYVKDSQLNYDEDTRIKCHTILEYLYSIVSNDKENATDFLQIQKMDLRTAQVVKVDENTLALVPTITGEAEKVVIEHKKRNQPDNKLTSLIKENYKKINNNEFALKECVEAIEFLLIAREKCAIPFIYDHNLVDFLVIALQYEELNVDIRARYCQIWIDGIKNLFLNRVFMFEYSHSWGLFSQVEGDVCDKVKNQIKQLMIDLIMNKEQHGVISKIAFYAKQYLETNKQLAKAIFYTIVKLAEDEKNHQKYNVECRMKYDREKKLKVSSNLQPKFLSTESYREENQKEGYKSQKEEIFNKYLYNSVELSLINFNIVNYDITTLCYTINCGLSLEDDFFAIIVKEIVKAMINVWKANQNTYCAHHILGVCLLYDVMDFFRRELMVNEDRALIVLDILFTGVDFSKFTKETTEFYLEVFGGLLSCYFDSYNDKAKREYCKKIICMLEEEVAAVREEKVKIELYKSLILSITKYGGSGNWSQLPSGYSYLDKQFLNNLFSKYGKFHFEEMLNTIYKLHIDKLLPEILLSVRDIFKSVQGKSASNPNELMEVLRSEKQIVLRIITKAFLDFGDIIKQDNDLTEAFEEILQLLIKMNYEEAATIIDEFRVH